ncbi:DUF802 domain-containing protein [Hydrogenophaga sp.]|uniref:DUF802 domain-containing protein n=1 Tax=Hydrogenophaga sp. TaxID=1904254 RepID=UPI00260CC408|nr:DUF802 domain-containing protein [Hydrogenophaga sp.]MCW5652634.1 DUF802 domain-containing protein [Hydrogenophaga sp.]
MKMNHPILILAFAIGLATVAWVCWSATSALAVAMTLVIGAVYLFGALEVRRFRTDTAAFTRALANVPQPLEDVQAWLNTLPASLRQTVRLRLEGERAALPALALTPYLVGLLVMLGMLGTFLGMVVTFQGAVLALESSADLAAMRAALSAPIKGLGLSFGTSVAGVASSAMLGLMAAISRRERLAATRTLESHLATALHPFSHAHQRQAAYEALQQQARTLPAVVDSLQALVERMDQRSEQQHTQMLERQNLFHQDVGQAYNRLAQSVQTSLQDTLVASARAASESLKPVVETAMNRVAQDTTQLHERTVNALQTQLDGLCARWAETAHATAEGWRGHLQQQTQAQQTLVQELEHALEAFSGRFEQHATHWLTDTREALAQSAQQAAQAHREQAGQTLERMARLQAGVEELARSRIEAESRWISSHDQRLDEIAALWRNGLAELRNDEALRGQAAVDRLSSLQAEVAQHLADLGTALEAPLDRLLRTAAEVPEAAAGVISQPLPHLAGAEGVLPSH